MSVLTQEEFDQERERFIGMMVGQDAATVWKAQAKRFADECDKLEAEIERLRSIVGSAMAKLDTMNVCCRETACERASDEALQDSDCDLRIVRGLLAAYQQKLGSALWSGGKILTREDIDQQKVEET